MSDTGLINLRWADALLDGLASADLSQVVISPGSRSTPLVLACERHPAIATHVHLDERGAAFIALGLSKQTGRPAAVIATSGSAPGHWYPAVMEAGAAGIPLILLSADRPPELQGWGANQTLDQQRLFGVHVRAFHAAGVPEDSDKARQQIRQLGIKAIDQSLWPRPGPVHINLPLREPLIPAAPEADWPSANPGPAFPLNPPKLQADAPQLERLRRLMATGPGLLVCGPMLRPQAQTLVKLAELLNSPLLADPLSGLRFGPWPQDRLLTRYDSFLRHPPSLPKPQWVLRCGAAPVSKALNQFLADLDAAQFLLDPSGAWPDPDHRATEIVRCDPEALLQALSSSPLDTVPSDLMQVWLQAEDLARPDSTPPLEAQLIGSLVLALPPGTPLFIANSLPIRQFDTWSGHAEKPLRIHANRGVSGIDGNIATLSGIARGAGRPAAGLLGDLSLLHDLNSLSAVRDQHLILVVLNNGGGAIFGHLPQAGLAAFERYWLTPQDLSVEKIAALFGLQYHRAEDIQSFGGALDRALETPAPHLIEVRVDRQTSLDQHRNYWAQVGEKLPG